jgi:hypothetical protein
MKTAARARRLWERLQLPATTFTGADIVAIADSLVAGGLARKWVVDGETFWEAIPEADLDKAARRRMSRFLLGDDDWADEL